MYAESITQSDESVLFLVEMDIYVGYIDLDIFGGILFLCENHDENMYFRNSDQNPFK